MALLPEIRRRNVHRVALAYLAGAWLLIQVAATVVPAYDLPASVLTVLITVLLIGFIPAVILSWVFEWTPDGLRRDTHATVTESASAGKRLDRIIVVTLVLAVGYFALDKFLLDPARDAAREREVAQQARSEALVESYGDKSIAVLPFVNMSSDPEQEYFSDGISEELLNLLAKIPELRVISRSTAFTFKGKEIVISEVAKKLNVAHILEGSVRRSGNRVRITAQLIDARSDTHLWSETYDRELDDIFAIQDEISAKVVADLKLRLLGSAPKAQEIDPKAYDLYLQARRLLHLEWNADRNRAAAGLLEQAVALEPNWQRAIFELTRAYYRLSVGADGRELHEPRIRALVERLDSIELDGSAAASWKAWLAWHWDDDPIKAAMYFERAAEVDPYNLDLLRPMTDFLIFLQRYDDALAVSGYLVERDPGCTVCVWQRVIALSATGREREAAEQLEAILEWHPASDSLYADVGTQWLVAGDPQKALDFFSRQQIPNEDDPGRLLALHDLGRTKEFEDEFARYIEHNADNPEGIARVYVWTGNNDKAFLWLERMVEMQGPQSAELLNADLYTRLESDPRWSAFLEKYQRVGPRDTGFQFQPKLPPEIRASTGERQAGR